MKPVLFIIERPTPQRAPVLDALNDQGLPMLVIYLHGDEAEQGWGSLSLHHPHVFAGPGVSALSTAREILAHRYSVIVSMGYRGSIRTAALSAARVSKTPIVMRFDTNQIQIESSDPLRRRVRRAAMKAVIPRNATAWAIGNQNERFWRQELNLDSVELIPYEVPVLPGDVPSHHVTQPRHSDPHAMRFLYVGRLAAIKNVADAIQAFSATQHPGWTFTIVGTGPQEKDLRALAATDPRIEFRGSRTYEDLGAEFQRADVLVLPSSGEPWGLVVNEALGYGLRVLASDQVGAAYDLLTPETGAMYPVGDVQALGAAMEDCAHHLAQAPRPAQSDTAALMLTSLRKLAGEPT